MKNKRYRLFYRLIKITCSILITLLAGSSLSVNAEELKPDVVSQSAREISIIKKVDVAIVGGTTAAVSAAVSAAHDGASVFLVAPRLYLGEDMVGTLRLKIDNERDLKTQVEKKIFGDQIEVTPLKVKAVLNEMLVNAGVDFVFGTFVTDVLKNENNVPSGIIIVNRSGRQAVLAKTIIDATNMGWICQMAGAKTNKFSSSEISFERTLIMDDSGENNPDYVTRQVNIQMPDLHFPSFALAEQIARKKTYTDEQIRSSENLFFIPPTTINGKKNARALNDQTKFGIDFFQPENLPNVFVLSGSADIPRVVAAELLKPAALCEVGEKIGTEASVLAKKTKFATVFSFLNQPTIKNKSGDIKEILVGLRPVNVNLETIKIPESTVPAISEYEVVVVGGGTSGAPAAISAARMGMKVLVVEFQEGLGGVGTLGLIGKPYHGRNVGFAAEVPFPKDNIEPKMEWYRSEIEKAGGDIWLGVLGCGAYMEGNQVKGAVVATPEGRYVIKANVVIDATGNGDVAIATGAEYMYGEIENGDIALQGTGLPSRPLIGNYLNTDYLLVDEMDMIDVWRTLVSVQRSKYAEDIFDVGSLIQNRERHRIIGDFEMHYLDQITGRTFPDAIVLSGSDYDSHGYPSADYFALLPHDSISRKENHPAPGGICYTSFRCLLPKNLDGILVTGLAISMERDASAMIRMQLDLANQGYAAGLAATLAITEDKKLREINIRELQTYLVEKGNLPEEVLKMKDSYPLPDKMIKQAVIDYGNSTNPKEAGKPLAIILTHKKRSLQLIKKEYKKSEGRKKLQYAEVLGMCGEKEGIEILKNELQNFKGWDEKIFQGSMADFAHLPTPIDAVILALGNSGDKNAVPLLINLVEKLDTNVTLSHHRSLALALEKLADSRAAEPLAKLLQENGMQGFSMQTLADASTQMDNDGKGPNPVKNSSYFKRTKSLREIVLARALYKCGDYNGIGKNILENYRKDLRGLFVLHANKILNGG